MKKYFSYLLLNVFLMCAFYCAAQTTIKMEETSGVYKIPCKVNGLNLKFIFDTGASDVSISLTEALFMIKNEYLNSSDFLGKEYYQIANGEIQEGTKVNLRCIEIAGQKIYNVKASITHTTDAPLLLGQSALQKFGKFSIDYSTASLIFGNNPKMPSITRSPKVKDGQKICKDIDGNIYKTIKIGTQSWMKEDLKTTHYRDGSMIREIEDNTIWGDIFNNNESTPAWCNIRGDNDANLNYGNLYNWYAVTDSRNICPIGWHVPTDNEFQILVNNLGGDNVAGGKMKFPLYWIPPNTSADNLSLFSSIPAGYRFFDGDFVAIGKYNSFWCSTQDSPLLAWSYDLRYNSPAIFRLSFSKKMGYSVRCIED